MAQSDFEEFVQGNNAFAIDLYSQLKSWDGNLFLSPFSISVALAMTYAGARGDTETQVRRILHFGLEQERLHAAFSDLQKKLEEVESTGGIQLKIANSLWPQEGYPFLAKFISLIQKYYGVTITPLNYYNAEAARKTINAWVEAKTEKKITDLIPPRTFNDLTRLTLVNAIYFKGNWQDQFDARLTKTGEFWSAGDPLQALMMNRTGNYPYRETESLQVLELPYAARNLSMLILLPKERDGLAALENQLTPALLAEVTTKLLKQSVNVAIPNFKVETTFWLNESLKALGMVDAFDMERANFAGMDGKENNLFISAALHKAFIDVNEEGSEAAAATALVMRTKGFEEPIEFRADHPFLFLIRENQSGSIIFMGRMVKL